MTALRLAGVIRESIVDGPGFRYVVFAQGCPHHCLDCHNVQTWPFDGGHEAAPESIIADMKKNPLLSGITLSGGEPFSQPRAMAQLASLAREVGYDVYTYTGFIYEDLLDMSRDDSDVRALLDYTDVLIDGPFMKDKAAHDLPFRGSANQRMITLHERAGGRMPPLRRIAACRGGILPPAQ